MTTAPVTQEDYERQVALVMRMGSWLSSPQAQLLSSAEWDEHYRRYAEQMEHLRVMGEELRPQDTPDRCNTHVRESRTDDRPKEARKETEMRLLAQGDVLLLQVDQAPKGTPEKAENGRLILARGEQTGHHHSVAEVHASLIRDIEERELYLTIHEATPLEHQEHAAIELPAGTYRIITQSEYTPEAIQRVAD
jgi:hypothetical protein